MVVLSLALVCVGKMVVFRVGTRKAPSLHLASGDLVSLPTAQPSSGVESSGVESSANSSEELLLWMRPSLRMLWKVLRNASIMEWASFLASSLLSHTTAWQSIWKVRSSLIYR